MKILSNCICIVCIVYVCISGSSVHFSTVSFPCPNKKEKISSALCHTCKSFLDRLVYRFLSLICRTSLAHTHTHIHILSSCIFLISILLAQKHKKWFWRSEAKALTRFASQNILSHLYSPAKIDWTEEEAEAVVVGSSHKTVNQTSIRETEKEKPHTTVQGYIYFI